jgi:hypothetical protein
MDGGEVVRCRDLCQELAGFDLRRLLNFRSVFAFAPLLLILILPLL